MDVIARASGLTKTYAKRTVVDDVSFELRPGEVVVLVGPNGSGKTTTMEMLIGLRRPTAGSAEIVGISVLPGGPHRPYVGVQLQQAGLPNRLRVGEALESTAALYASPEDPRALLNAVGLHDVWKKSIDKLSGGQQRRLDVALACVGRAPLLVLDEPTSGLDPEGRADLWELLRSEARGNARAILTSTHDLGEAEAFADRVLLIRDGRLIVNGTVAETLRNAGGDWRLRMAHAPAAAARIAEAAQVRALLNGGTLVCIGSQEAIEGLRGDFAQHSDLQHVDVVTGRARLEDVFLFAGRETSTH